MAAPSSAPSAPSGSSPEEKALAIPGVANATESPVFRRFVEELVPKLRTRAMSRAVLDAFSNVDVKAEKVATVLQLNPYYQFNYLKVIASLSKREQQPSVEAAVVLLGMQNTRNLILALQLQRSIQGTHPEWGKDGKLTIKATDLLKFALKTEEVVLASGPERRSYAESAFAAGLLFDALALLSAQTKGDPKKTAAFVEAVYTQGMKAANVAVAAAPLIQDFAFKKHAFSAALVKDVGKIVLAILEPDYLAFSDDCDKKGLNKWVRDYAEKKRYGVSHSLLGSQVCYHFRSFRAFDQSLLFQDEPYLLRERNKHQYQLASLISLAGNVAQNYKAADKLDDPIIALWKTPELAGFKIDMPAFMTVANRVISGK